MIKKAAYALKDARKMMFDILNMCHSAEDNRACLDTIHALTKAITFAEEAAAKYDDLINLHRNKAW